MKNFPYMLVVAFIIVGGIVGWAIPAIQKASTTAQSHGTGWGALAGLVVGVLVAVVGRPKS